jgi:methylmalonyl-CoA/ethylmalonyl-CoA epimerase
MRFDHIGITTVTLEAGRVLLEASVGVTAWTRAFEDPINDVWAQFGADGSGICYELLAPRSARAPIAGALSKKVNVINHVAYLVDDLTSQAKRLAVAGFVEIGPARPAIAYRNRPIQFFVSKSRLMIELIEAPGHQHSYVRNE